MFVHAYMRSLPLRDVHSYASGMGGMAPHAYEAGMRHVSGASHISGMRTHYSDAFPIHLMFMCVHHA